MALEQMVITRFNVNVGYADPLAGLNEEWLEQRFKFFDDYCYPTLRAQTEQNFKWLVLFNAATPEKYRARIAQYAQWKNFHAVFIEGKCTHDSCRNAIRQVLAPATEFLITTRLDNDDGLALDFIERIRRQFRGQDFEFINVLQGYQLAHGRLYQVSLRNNAFMSLIEKLDRSSEAVKFSSIICGAHYDLHKLGKVVDLAGPPRWMQVIHGGNIANEIRATAVRRRQGRLHKNFVLGAPLPRERYCELAMDYCRSAPAVLLARVKGRIQQMKGKWRGLQRRLDYS